MARSLQNNRGLNKDLEGKGETSVLIYLTAREIKNIFEKSQPCSTEELDQALRRGGHKLVFSWLNITEVAESLLYSKEKTQSLELLGKIEALPHIYINSAAIPRMELATAVEAFGEGGHCGEIQPLAQRFDFIIGGRGTTPFEERQEYPLAEIVWDLYSFGALGNENGCAEKLRGMCGQDRKAASKPEPVKHFSIMLARNMRLFQVPVSIDQVDAFGGWVFDEPSRCPAQRLRHEMWLAMVKNPEDELDMQGWQDFSHIDCLPYVDIATLDRGVGQVVFEVSDGMKRDYASRVVTDAKGALNRL